MGKPLFVIYGLKVAGSAAPVGMNDILTLGRYANTNAAKQFLLRRHLFVINERARKGGYAEALMVDGEDNEVCRWKPTRSEATPCHA